MLNNIEIITKENQIPDVVQRIDLNRDVVFSFLTDSKVNLNFDYSGVIHFGMGEEINLAVLKNKVNPNSPIRIFKSKIPMKFCCPSGIAPIFLKPSSSKAIISTTPTYSNFIDIKIDPNSVIGKDRLYSNSAVIYQNIEVETTFNKDLLISDFPSMILPSSFQLFDLLLVQTIFSDTLTIGKIFVIQSTEFFNNFKESV